MSTSTSRSRGRTRIWPRPFSPKEKSDTHRPCLDSPTSEEFIAGVIASHSADDGEIVSGISEEEVKWHCF